MSGEDFDMFNNRILDQNERANRAEDGASHETGGYESVHCGFCERLWQLGYPTLLALGLVGNALCLVVFALCSKLALRRETRALCSVRAAVDSLALAFAFASRWPLEAFATHTVNANRVLCHVLAIGNYWLPELAAWTLVSLSFERSLAGKSILLLFEVY